MAIPAFERGPASAELLLDIEKFAHEQLEGGPPEARAERAQQLTERWQGTLAAFSVLDGGIPTITREGFYADGGELATFDQAEGTIESITPAPGGGVEVNLDDGSCMKLSLHGNVGDKAEDCESGWEVSVASKT